MLGIYDDDLKEMQIFSFFHELGHCLQPHRTAINTLAGYEYNAWVTGWNISREKYHILWSDKALFWAAKRFLSYEHSERAEKQ